MITKEIQINNTSLKVEIADTIEEAKKGLSGRQSLCNSCGMLFEYPNYQIMNYWMNDMNFPLDIIWIRDNTIVGINENISVLDEKGNINKVKSPLEVNRVLEVNSGYITQNRLKIGDIVEWY